MVRGPTQSTERLEQSIEHPAREARAEARSGSGWYAWLARGGLVAKGVSFGIVGALAVGVALGTGGKTTSRQGALQALAQHAWGKVLLVLLAVGFAAYGVWRFVQAYAERDEDGDAGALKKWGKRAGYVGRGIIYAGLTVGTIKILVGAGGQQSAKPEGAEDGSDRARLARRPLDRGRGRRGDRRRRSLERLPWHREEVRRQVAHR